MEIRTLHIEDTPSLHALIQMTAYERRLDMDELYHRIWDDTSALPHLLLGAFEGDQLVGFCLGLIREGRGVISLFGVDPASRRQGIATALFDTQEQQFTALGIAQSAVEGVGPGYFWPGVELTRGLAIAFLLGRGYETDRVARVDMLVNLQTANLDSSAAAARLAGEGITVRRAEAQDIPGVAAFALRFFSRGWQLEVEEAARFAMLPLHIALCEGEVVGFAAFDVTGYGRFGPTGTRPDMRKRGIGGALLKGCLLQMRERGDTTAEIAWAGPVSFYTREAGAEINRVYWGFRKRLI